MPMHHHPAAAGAAVHARSQQDRSHQQHNEREPQVSPHHASRFFRSAQEEKDPKDVQLAQDLRNAGVNENQVEDLNNRLQELDKAAAILSQHSRLDEAMRRKWTQSNRCSGFVGLFVVLNAVCLGCEADYGDDNPQLFQIAEHIFTAIFTLEVIARLSVEGPKLYFGDNMNWLDFILVSLAVIDAWIIRLFGLETEQTEKMRQVSVLRILRLMRMARLVKLIRVFKELTLLVKALVDTVRTLFWSFVFLLCVVYAFALFAQSTIGEATQCSSPRPEVAAEPEQCEAFYTFNEEIGNQEILFGSVSNSMLTLFICLTEGCGMEVAKPTTLQTPPLIIFWLLFTFVTTLGLLNLIIGLICEGALASAAESEREMTQAKEEKRERKILELRKAFVELDTDGSNDITREEYFHAIQHDDALLTILVEIGVGNEVNLFDKLDSDHNGVLTFNEFFNGVTLLMKGQDTAKAKDIVGTHLICEAVQRDVKRMLAQLNHCLEFQSSCVTKEDLHRLEAKLEARFERLETMIANHCTSMSGSAGNTDEEVRSSLMKL